MIGASPTLRRATAAVFLLCAAAAAFIAVAPFASADSPPPVSGDWWVTEDTQVENATIQVDGAIHVTNLSVLTLRNVTLRFVSDVGSNPFINLSAGTESLFDQSQIVTVSPARNLTGWVAGRLDATNTSFRDLFGPLPGGAYGLFVSGGSARFDGCSFPATGGAARFAVDNGGALEIANSSLASPRLIVLMMGSPAQPPSTFWTHDLAFLGAGSGVAIDAVNSASQSQIVRLERIVQSGASPPGLIGISAHAALDLRLTNVDAVGSGSGIGLVLNIEAPFNGNISASRFSGFAQAMRVNRPLAIAMPSSLRIDGVDLNGTDYGLRIEGNTSADLGFPVYIAYSHIASDNFALAIYHWRAFVDNSTLIHRYSYLALYVIESIVIMHNVDHNSSAVLHDARGYALEQVDAWWTAPTQVVWKEGGAPAYGWNVSLILRVGGNYLSGPVEPDGRIAGAPGDVLVYHFTLNASVYDRDARTLNGTLSRAGRADVKFSVPMTGNLSVYKIEVHDPAPPEIILVQPMPPYVNTTRVVIVARLLDLETGTVAVRATITPGAAFANYSGPAAPFWEVAFDLNVTAFGSYKLELRAHDLAGNEAVSVYTLVVDRTAPVLVSSDPRDGSSVNRTTFDLTLVFDDALAWATVDGAQATFPPCEIPCSATLRGWVATVAGEEGPHTFVVVASDLAGNQATFLIHITIDITPPNGSVSGIHDGDIFNVSSVPIQVTRAVEDTVLVDGAPYMSATPVVYATIELTTGVSTHGVVIVDAAGNTLAFVYTVLLDQDPPSLALAGRSGTSEVFVRSTDVAFDLATSFDTVEVTDGTSQWVPDLAAQVHVAFNLPEGVHDLHFVAVDVAGNTGTLDLRVVVDLTPPAIYGLLPPNNTFWRQETIEFLVTLTERGEIEFNHVRPAMVDSVFHISAAVIEGLNDYVLLLNDTAGNTAEIHVYITGDFTAPLLQVAEPANHSFRPSGAVHVSGHTEPGAQVRAGDEDVAVAADGSFAADVAMAPGTLSVVVIATDRAGNRAVTVLVLDGEKPVDLIATAGLFAVPLALLVLGVFLVRRLRARPSRPSDPSRGPQRKD